MSLQMKVAKEMGAEVMAGGSWDQYLFPSKGVADKFIEWLRDRGLSYQVVGQVGDKYRVRCK